MKLSENSGGSLKNNSPISTGNNPRKFLTKSTSSISPLTACIWNNVKTMTCLISLGQISELNFLTEFFGDPSPWPEVKLIASVSRVAFILGNSCCLSFSRSARSHCSFTRANLSNLSWAMILIWFRTVFLSYSGESSIFYSIYSTLTML